MRLKSEQVTRIRDIVHELAGCQAEVRVFGSRLDDSARGGDVDVFVSVPYTVEEPALLTARIAGRLSRALDGRKVDVVLAAPNLRALPIHETARREGVLL